MNWQVEQKRIETNDDINNMLSRCILARTSNYIFIDTETNGLNIINARPFMFQVGWLEDKDLVVFYWRIENLPIDVITRVLQLGDIVYAHNVKFDMHMLYNVGVDVEKYEWGDTMTLARLGTYVDVPGSLGLKSLYSYHLKGDISASKEIDSAMTALTRERTLNIQSELKDCVAPDGHKSWTKKLVEDYVNPKKFDYDINTLPDDIRIRLEDAIREFYEPTYENIDYSIMEKYGADDIVMGISILEYFQDIVNQRCQQLVLTRENQLILPLWRIERRGIPTSVPYLQESAKKLLDIIRSKRAKMRLLCGDDTISPGASGRIKDLLDTKWGIEVEKTDKKMLMEIVSNKQVQERLPDALEFVKTVIELRRLEKWYSTYAIKVLNNVVDGKLHTAFNQASTKSGRFSSDVHQFPKESIEVDGVEVFTPRAAFIVPAGSSAVFLDFSQIELRCQADYTLSLGGDVNLCRAYMPFRGISMVTGEQYSTENDEHLQHWNSGEWLVIGEPWTPTDLHSLTTQNAFPNLDVNSAEFKKMRSYGKTTNFAKNYGGGRKAVTNAVPIGTASHIIDALNESYGLTYPRVQEFSNSVIEDIKTDGYAENKFNRRYYFKYDDGLYKAANYMVQGSCADMLKICIIRIDRYMRENNLKSYMFSHVHDEIQFMFVKEELHHTKNILKIMQTFPDKFRTPIVSDAEISTTNWAQKEDLHI